MSIDAKSNSIEKTLSEQIDLDSLKVTIETRGFPFVSNNSQITIDTGSDYYPNVLQVDKIKIPNVGTFYNFNMGTRVNYPSGYSIPNVISSITIPGLFNFIEDRPGGVAHTSILDISGVMKSTPNMEAYYQAHPITIRQNGSDGYIIAMAISGSCQSAATYGYFVSSSVVFVPEA